MLDRFNLAGMIAAMARTFGENLKRVRDEKGISQEELARRLKLKRQARISVLETTGILPRDTTIVRYARALQCEPGELLKDVETGYDRLKRGLPLESAQRVRAPAERQTARGRRASSR